MGDEVGALGGACEGATLSEFRGFFSEGSFIIVFLLQQDRRCAAVVIPQPSVNTEPVYRLEVSETAIETTPYDCFGDMMPALPDAQFNPIESFFWCRER